MNHPDKSDNKNTTVEFGIRKNNWFWRINIERCGGYNNQKDRLEQKTQDNLKRYI